MCSFLLQTTSSNEILVHEVHTEQYHGGDGCTLKHSNVYEEGRTETFAIKLTTLLITAAPDNEGKNTLSQCWRNGLGEFVLQCSNCTFCQNKAKYQNNTWTEKEIFGGLSYSISSSFNRYVMKYSLNVESWSTEKTQGLHIQVK